SFRAPRRSVPFGGAAGIGHAVGPGLGTGVRQAVAEIAARHRVRVEPGGTTQVRASLLSGTTLSTGAGVRPAFCSTSSIVATPVRPGRRASACQAALQLPASFPGRRRPKRQNLLAAPCLTRA
ncbi:hypothetical protein ACFT9I_39965, partial [Streptomyces sp. NPDC057137]|uniref:hypothetical protein n=1 Tax=Streptomyces sp. NPDC057137 TaxID=3346030 RepID=UPI00363BCA1B